MRPTPLTCRTSHRERILAPPYIPMRGPLDGFEKDAVEVEKEVLSESRIRQLPRILHLKRQVRELQLVVTAIADPLPGVEHALVLVTEHTVHPDRVDDDGGQPGDALCPRREASGFAFERVPPVATGRHVEDVDARLDVCWVGDVVPRTRRLRFASVGGSERARLAEELVDAFGALGETGVTRAPIAPVGTDSFEEYLDYLAWFDREVRSALED